MKIIKDLEGFTYDGSDTINLKILKGSISEYYREKLELEDLFWVATAYRHTSRVVQNLGKIDDVLGNSISELAYAAALCHDIGRFSEKPKWRRKAGWDRYRNQNHAKVSGKECVGYLRNAGYDNTKIKHIRRLAVSHNDKNVAGGSSLELRALQIADQMDRFSPDGVIRLFENQVIQYPEMSKKEKVKVVEEMMNRGYGWALRLNLVRDLVDQTHQDGLAKLAELKAFYK